MLCKLKIVMSGDLKIREFVSRKRQIPRSGCVWSWGRAQRSQDLGARIGPLHPAGAFPTAQPSVPPVGLGWLTADGALVWAIFPARWACIAPSFSFSSTSCEDRHRVRPQPALSLPLLCPGCGLPWECPAPFLPSGQAPSWVSLAPGMGWTDHLPHPHITCCSRDCTTSLWSRHCALPFSSRRWSAWQCLGRGKSPRG